MPAEKHTAAPKTEPASLFSPAAISAGLDAWKAQPAAVASYCSEILSEAEVQTRRQADFLGQLSRCKDLPEALGVQMNFAQEFWANSFQQFHKALLAARKTVLPAAET
ncbi:MAG: hypothetical protein DI527_01130 [Chelatococcus sp.]|nr:MAG: hypothetical protein DI527_01130 [Chelatococcus sp.]